MVERIASSRIAATGIGLRKWRWHVSGAEPFRRSDKQLYEAFKALVTRADMIKP